MPMHLPMKETLFRKDPELRDHTVADDDLQSYFQSSSSQVTRRNDSALIGFVCVLSAQPLRVAVLVAQLW